MVRHGAGLWAKHPHVANDLTLGERASDQLKHWFGTWTLLAVIALWIGLWLGFVNDPGELHLNLALSCIAAVQGIVLQIAANRGDRLNAEVALHTQANTDALMKQGAEIKTLTEQQTTMLRQHTQMLTELRQLRAEIAAGTDDGPAPESTG